MAIRGFFSDTRSAGPGGKAAAYTAVPYVEALVHLPQFQRRAAVTFLVDTGADATILHPQDGLRLLNSQEIRALPNAQSTGGVGGEVNSYPVEATVAFLHDDGRLHTTQMTVFLAEPTPTNQWLDSLLGRDALDQFVMHFDQRARILTLGT